MARRLSQGESGGSATCGTRRRALPMMVAGFLGLVALHQLVSTNALAVNFNTADTSFRLYTNYLEGIAGAGFLSSSSKATAAQEGVAEIGLKEAHLAGLCLVSDAPVPGLPGSFSLVITAGVPVKGSFDNSTFDARDGAGAPITTDAAGALSGSSLDSAVTVRDLFLSATALSGYGNNVSGLDLGDSADQVQTDAGTTPWPSGQTAPAAGGWGLAGEHLNLADLDGQSFGIDLAGTAHLPHLHVGVYPSGSDQARCEEQAN